MRFSESWLRALVDLDGIGREELVARLTMAGLEVDAVEPVAGAFEGVVTARIVAAEPHPDADKLRVCRVDDGSAETLQIVCGAPNARPGLLAPLARVGAVLPGDFRIGKAKLRGVASAGMLCSAKELGLSDDAAGLLELPTDLPAGQDLRTALALDDVSIEIDLTPNRADCLGMAGLAQEVAAIFARRVTMDPVAPVPAVSAAARSVVLADPSDCARYVGRVIEGVDPRARSPLWLVERLRRAGLRSISPLVDVTNYVMLELGQPMHAFDEERLTGTVTVRRASEGESLTLLDGTTVTLDPSFLLIADDAGPLAIGGVMGGLASACTDATRSVFLESAWFRPATIVGKARALGMHTDSAHRFERGVDPEGQRAALERATELLVAIAGGTPGPVIEAVAPEHLPPRRSIHLRADRIGRLLGQELAGEEVEAILGHLGMVLAPTDDGWRVAAPSRRFDMAIEEDLIEEVARIHGYDRLPARPPTGAIPAVVLPEGRFDRERARHVLVGRGYAEAINFSFVAPDQLEPLGGEALALANPLSTDLSVMRTSLVPGLLANLVFNRHRQQPRVRLFEIGTVFPIEGGSVVEHTRLAAVATGLAAAEQWGVTKREVDFFDLKGDLEALLTLTGDDATCFAPARHRWLHPGQGADVFRGDRRVGWLGALHPAWTDRLDTRGRVFAFEIDLGALGSVRLPVAAPVSRYPSVRRDLALLVDSTVPWAAIQEVVQETAGNLLTGLVVFDEYRGLGIGEGKRSVALGLILQHGERTLTDDEVDALVSRVEGQLAARLDAQLRD